MYFTPFPCIGFFILLSTSRFVLSTQGQLEDCFQPPVSSPACHVSLYEWPSAPERWCAIHLCMFEIVQQGRGGSVLRSFVSSGKLLCVCAVADGKAVSWLNLSLQASFKEMEMERKL